MESKENTSITDAGEDTGKKKAIKPWIIGLAAVALVAVVAFGVMRSDNAESDPEKKKKTQLIYSCIAPVVINEGEMLEAVLVNRLIVDTEPSPVICNISRDLFCNVIGFCVPCALPVCLVCRLTGTSSRTGTCSAFPKG